MSTTLKRMNHCFALAHVAGEKALGELLEALNDPEWRVRLAAVVALGDRRERAAVRNLLQILEEESNAPIYSQPKEFVVVGAAQVAAAKPVFPDGTTDAEKSAWERRGRLKQAVCLSLGAIGIVDERIIAILGDYASSMREDGAVRSAAAKSLGLLGDPAALPYLEKAARDGDWCPRTEAQKAIRQITAGSQP